MKIKVSRLKTIQITLPLDLLERIDEAVTEQRTNRSEFARKAFEDALFRSRIEQMERQDAEGCARQPQSADEIAPWESIQDWGHSRETR